MANDDVRRLLILTFEKTRFLCGFPVRVAGRCGGGDVTALSCFIFDPMCHLCFSGEPTYETGYGTRQIRLICEWDLGLTCLADPHRLEKNPAFPNAPQKRPNGGWYGDQGLFPYSGGESLTQAHTAGTARRSSFVSI